MSQRNQSLCFLVLVASLGSCSAGTTIDKIDCSRFLVEPGIQGCHFDFVMVGCLGPDWDPMGMDMPVMN